MNAVLISPCYASRLHVIVQTGEKYRLGRKRDVFLNEWFQYVLQNRGAFILKGKEPNDFDMCRDTDPGTQRHIPDDLISLKHHC